MPTIVAMQPQLILTYSPDNHEFTLKVTNVTKVDYTLSYTHLVEGEPVENGFTGGGKAVRNQFIANEIAGTESADDVLLHTPTGGTLSLIVDTLEGTTENYIKTFTISETGVLTLTDGAVLGEDDLASASATASESAITAPTIRSLPAAAPVQTEVAQGPSQLESMALPIVGVVTGILVVAVIGFGIKKKMGNS